MDFARSVEYLFSLGNEVSAMKLGLENIRTLLAAFGNPHEKYIKVQVAGTNGKGSVCAFLDSICNEAGIATGTYTSPHLVSITERIRINGVDITEDEFARIANVVRETSDSLLSLKRLEYRPTFFEQMTAIALVAFAEANVQLAILETGLGGRLDATTAAKAEIAAITRIDLDHQEYLGDTIEQIAAEKAAIIQPGSKVAISDQDPRAMGVILDRCGRSEIRPRFASQITCIKEPPATIRSPQTTYAGVLLGLRGNHQVENAKVAILIAETLQEHFPISTQNVIDGLRNARHPGRLELSGKFLFDGAHNAGGAFALRAYVDRSVTRPITMIFGAMKGKDIAVMAETLFPVAETLILTRPENSRAMSADELKQLVPRDLTIRNLVLTDSVKEAISEAERRSPDQGLILVTGSLYLVGEAKKLLQEKATAEI